jgi:protein-disulfide isomerase
MQENTVSHQNILDPETLTPEPVLAPGVIDHPHHVHGHIKHHTKFTLTTPLAVIIGAVIIACGIMGYGLITKDGTQTKVAMFGGKAIDDKDYIDGNAKSHVIVIEYSDPECPFCVQLHPTMKKIRGDYKDKVAFVYRHFPLTQIHSHAYDESRALACAGTLGGTSAFYEYLDSLFGYKITNRTTQLPQTGKEDIAKNIGLDISAFTSCMKTNQTAATIDTSTEDGIAAGVQGTPASFVLLKTRKGYEVISSVDGARDYAYIKAAIEEALAR